MDYAACLTHLMMAGELGGNAARLWHSEILEPVDCGPAQQADLALPQVVGGRKIRPISLAEAWVKLADKAGVAAGAAQFRAALEPRQLGAGYPDGVVGRRN